mgnify:FL=1
MQFALEYLFACLVMGTAIGMDLAIVSALYSRQLNCIKQRTIWVSGVVGTHTVLPMCGYLLSFYGIKWLPAIAPILGVIAFAFIAYYLYQEMFSNPNEGSELHHAISWSLIFAVSWDALWSGPAKSAQVLEWQPVFVWTSFLVVGGLVYVFTLLGLRLGKKFGQRESPMALQWVQYSAIAYFGLLALFSYTFSLTLPKWQIFVFSSLIIGLVLIYRQKMLYVFTGVKE